MLRARSAKPAEGSDGRNDQKEKERKRWRRRRSGWMREERGSRYIIRRRSRERRSGKKEEQPLSSFRQKRRASASLSLSLHLLKQYNNSFLSHSLSKIFYCDESLFRAPLRARRIVSPRCRPNYCQPPSILFQFRNESMRRVKTPVPRLSLYV